MTEQLNVEARDWQSVAMRVAQEKVALDAAYERLARAATELQNRVTELEGNLSEQEVIDYVAERVAPYKKIRLVEFIDAIPKIPSGKILRRKLIKRERAAVAV